MAPENKTYLEKRGSNHIFLVILLAVLSLKYIDEDGFNKTYIY